MQRRRLYGGSSGGGGCRTVEWRQGSSYQFKTGTQHDNNCCKDAECCSLKGLALVERDKITMGLCKEFSADIINPCLRKDKLKEYLFKNNELPSLRGT